MTFSPLGVDLFGEPIRPAGQGAIAARYDIPPFTVLSARDGDWQERKRAWIAYGIRSELGRGDPPGLAPRPSCDYSEGQRGDGGGRPLASSYQVGDWMADSGGGSRGAQSGTSVFDPVLTEMFYKWFCPPGGVIVDPFAGGSVRGVVAGMLGFRYHGIELRPEQVDANRAQAADICPEANIVWALGDCREVLADAPPADFIFTCPPYGDLERYSDDPKDLSTLEYTAFREAMRTVAELCYDCLKPNRFLGIVVGDFRDTSGPGYYRNFPGDTVAAFLSAGFGLYNEAILVTAVGSLPVRIAGQFDANRKMGKTHQNLYIFGKGDPRRVFAAP